MGAIRVVFDTNVIVSAIGWDGKPEACIELAFQEVIQPITSSAMEDELHEVLTYPKFDFTADDVFRVAYTLSTVSERVDPAVELDVVPDAADNMFIECAVAGDADYIVSGDSHLLDLESYEGIEVVAPDEFLTAIDPGDNGVA